MVRRITRAQGCGLAVTLALGLLGCAQPYPSKQGEQAVAKFESGSTSEALGLAHDLAKADKNLSAFLVYQFSLFLALKNDQSATAIDGSASWLTDAQSQSHTKFRGAMIAANAFSLYSQGDAAAAMQALGAECRSWSDRTVADCASAMLGEALGNYYPVHEKLEATYLYESAYIFEQVVPGKALGGEFFKGLALMEINPARANGIFKEMIARGQFTLPMAQQYCGFTNAGPYERVLDCSKVPEAKQSFGSK